MSRAWCHTRLAAAEGGPPRRKMDPVRRGVKTGGRHPPGARTVGASAAERRRAGPLALSAQGVRERPDVRTGARR